MSGATSRSVLEGLRILDFSWVLAGPFATRLLADFGAEVIKIQPLLPEAPDRYSRAYHNHWNRNKSGLGLDVTKPQGLEIVRRLITISDAVVENFSPRVMAGWGLEYPELKKLKPDIILLSLSLTGHSGPYRDYVGFGPAVQAIAGMTCLTAYSENEPVGLGYSYSDHIAGLYGALALQGALEYRDRTGEGQFIDLSQTETMLSLLADPFMQQTRFGKKIAVMSNHSAMAAPQGVYPCRGADQWCAITVSSDQEWQNFKKAIGLPAWVADARFDRLSDRQKNFTELDQLITRWTLRQAAGDAAETLQAAGIAAEAVRTAADLVNDPQLQQRGFFIHLEQSGKGDTISDACPIRLSDTPAEYRRSAPLRGQDNDYILGTLLGMNEAEIQNLRHLQVIS